MYVCAQIHSIIIYSAFGSRTALTITVVSIAVEDVSIETAARVGVYHIGTVLLTATDITGTFI